MPVQLEVTTENLLNAVAQMPDGEFDRFIEKARRIRQSEKTKNQSVSPAEADLLHKINTIFRRKNAVNITNFMRGSETKI